jgi:hypothetical protein
LGILVLFGLNFHSQKKEENEIVFKVENEIIVTNEQNINIIDMEETKEIKIANDYINNQTTLQHYI